VKSWVLSIMLIEVRYLKIMKYKTL